MTPSPRGLRNHPPLVLEWLCAAVLPRDQREVVLGDLEEEYSGRLALRGAREANRWYVQEIVRSLGPTLSRLPSRLFTRDAYGADDLATTLWFAVVAMIAAACVFATRL